jgi:hypothetical protein
MVEVSHLSVVITIALNSWFDDPALEKGLRLLAEAGSLIFRYTAGVCFPATSEIIAILSFAVNQQIRQGFTIKEAHCSLFAIGTTILACATLRPRIKKFIMQNTRVPDTTE